MGRKGGVQEVEGRSSGGGRKEFRGLKEGGCLQGKTGDWMINNSQEKAEQARIARWGGKERE